MTPRPPPGAGPMTTARPPRARRYWERRFNPLRVRKPENFLGIGAFLHFPGGGSEKVRGDFFGKIFKMIHCDTLFRV
jgi:hypothetical protein